MDRKYPSYEGAFSCGVAPIKDENYDFVEFFMGSEDSWPVKAESFAAVIDQALR